MSIDPHSLLAAALSVRVTADTTGLDAEIASRLTVAERRALLTSERVSAAAGKVAEVGAASSAKLEVATLRQTAAQESYNRLLRAGETDTIRLARSQASLITAQAGVRREQARLTETTAATAATGEAATVGLLGGTRNLVGAAAGIGVFTALKRGVGAYEQLTGSVRSFQRATGAAAPDASRFVAILDRYGLSGDRATQAILRFGRNISEHPEKLKEFGVQIARNSDGTVNLTKSLLNVNDAFHKTPDASTRASLALSLFGRGGQSLLPILAANRDTLQGFMDQAERSGVVFSQADLDRAKQLAMSQRDLTQAWQGFEILLARGVIPVLHDVDKVGTDVMNLFTSHQTVGTAVLHIGEIAAGLYLVNRAIKTFDSVRNSTLFTKILNVRETDAQTAANGRLAASELAVARAATIEATALGGAGAAGVTAGAGGVYGSMAALRATIPAAGAAATLRRGVSAVGRGAGIIAFGDLVAETAGPSVQSGGFTTAFHLGQVSQANSILMDLFVHRYKNATPQQKAAIDAVRADAINATARASRGDYSALDAAISEGRLAYSNPGRIVNNTAPVIALRQARSVVTQQGQSYASGIDIFTRAASLTPRSDPQAVQALDSARTRAGDAARRVTLDEQKLNALRATGKATTLQLSSAEETLRLAKERSAKASQEVTDAEKKTHTERLPTARGLLGTLTSQANRAAEDAKAVQRLYAEGLKPDVVTKIVAENANKPGVLESVAKTLTPALAKQIQSQFGHLRFDGSIIAGTPQQWRKAGNERALDFMAGVEATFNNASPAVVAARVAGVQRKIDRGLPVTAPSRRRQRSLSGSPSLPHGA